MNIFLIFPFLESKYKVDLDQEINPKSDYLDSFNEFNYNYDQNYLSLNKRPSLNSQHSNDLLTTAELKSKLMNMGKASRTKLSKLAAKFSIRAKNKYNKALDQTALTCTNMFTSFAPLTNSSDSYYVKNDSNNNTIKNCDTLNSNKELNLIDQFQNLEDKEEETYDLERMKDLDRNISNNSSANNSRYKKVYKSFKSAIRRNSSASNTSTASNSSTPNGYALSNSSSNSSSKLNRYSSCLPHNDLANLNDYYTNDKSLNQVANDLNVFQNDYSYDKSNNNSFSSYDYSVYPYAKIVSSGGSSAKSSTLSKSSKKLLDKLKSQTNK